MYGPPQPAHFVILVVSGLIQMSTPSWFLQGVEMVWSTRCWPGTEVWLDEPEPGCKVVALLLSVRYLWCTLLWYAGTGYTEGRLQPGLIALEVSVRHCSLCNCRYTCLWCIFRRSGYDGRGQLQTRLACVQQIRQHFNWCGCRCWHTQKVGRGTSGQFRVDMLGSKRCFYWVQTCLVGELIRCECSQLLKLLDVVGYSVPMLLYTKMYFLFLTFPCYLSFLHHNWCQTGRLWIVPSPIALCWMLPSMLLDPSEC